MSLGYLFQTSVKQRLHICNLLPTVDSFISTICSVVVKKNNQNNEFRHGASCTMNSLREKMCSTCAIMNLIALHTWLHTLHLYFTIDVIIMTICYKSIKGFKLEIGIDPHDLRVCEMIASFLMAAIFDSTTEFGLA